MDGVFRGRSVRSDLDCALLARPQPVTTRLPASMPPVDHSRNRVESEQLRQREAVLAVGAPINRAVASDVDTDLVGAVGQPWTVDIGELFLSPIPLVAKRIVKRLDLPAAIPETRYRSVAPRVAEAV